MRKKINLNNAKNIHFIGIGGISMSGLAEILHRDGFNVSGSDDVNGENTRRLASLGVKVFIPNASDNITASSTIDLVVYTAAVKPDNPEYAAAAQLGIKMVERAAFIGEILHGYDPICIAGSHGKTTTTSMMAEIALAAGLDPTVSIGGHLLSSAFGENGVNYRVGNSPVFILEACEYSNSFHHWHPKIGVITNTDADHLDFFGSMENLIEAFAKFASNIRPDGVLVIQKGVKGYEKITKAAKCEIITFSVNDVESNNTDTENTITAENIIYNAEKPSFDVFSNKTFQARVDLPMPGRYNMQNALAAFAAAAWLNVPAETIAAALCKVSGTKRRFEFKGTYNEAKIIDDYAHHPTEIQACLAAARQIMNAAATPGKLICIFQPHTYTRTKNLLQDFATSFTDADEVVLVPIYAAREPFDPEISSEILAEAVKKYNSNVKFLLNFDEAKNYLKEVLRPTDIAITMGAGDVYELGEEIIGS